MIDIRAHIINGLGCGPARFSESLEMCRAAVAGGVREVVATPLWRAGQKQPPLPLAEFERKVSELTEQLGGALEIKTGFVFEFSTHLPGLVDLYGAGLALGGRDHLLISLPKTSVPAEAAGVWDGLARRGFSVVISSLECSLAFRRNLAVLDEWGAAGVKVQIDAAGVAGGYGREVQ
ncbi:MAG TPA: CpsB/CapC family capsule biosynthesis tyrosine phosphatase, partial [Pyrinomonadaceae bacterium]